MRVRSESEGSSKDLLYQRLGRRSCCITCLIDCTSVSPLVSNIRNCQTKKTTGSLGTEQEGERDFSLAINSNVYPCVVPDRGHKLFDQNPILPHHMLNQLSNLGHLLHSLAAGPHFIVSDRKTGFCFANGDPRSRPLLVLGPLTCPEHNKHGKKRRQELTTISHYQNLDTCASRWQPTASS